VEELEGKEIGGVESSLPPVDTYCASGQLGIKVATELYGGLFREPSRGGNEWNLDSCDGGVNGIGAELGDGLKLPGVPDGVLLTSVASGMLLSKYPLWWCLRVSGRPKDVSLRSGSTVVITRATTSSKPGDPKALVRGLRSGRSKFF